jgi:hypothetical protein
MRIIIWCWFITSLNFYKWKVHLQIKLKTFIPDTRNISKGEQFRNQQLQGWKHCPDQRKKGKIEIINIRSICNENMTSRFYIQLKFINVSTYMICTAETTIVIAEWDHIKTDIFSTIFFLSRKMRSYTNLWSLGAVNSLFPNCKGNQAGRVAREEVASTRLQVSVIILIEQLEARGEKLPLGLSLEHE